MGAVKNLFVRIGGDASGAVNSFKSASRAGSSAKESIKKSSAETRTAIRNGFSSPIQSVKEYIATVDKTKVAHETAKQNVSRLTDQIAQLEDVYGTIKNATDGLDLSKSLSQQISSTEKELDEINAKIHKTQASINRLGNPTSASKAERLAALQEELQSLIADSDDTAAHLQALDQVAGRIGASNMGHASASGLKALQAEITAAKNQLRTTQAVVDATGQKLKSLRVGPTLARGLKSVGASAMQAAKTGVANLGRGLKNLAGSSIRKIASIPGKLRDIGKSASAGCGGLGKMVKSIRNIGLVSLGVRVAAGMFGRLRSIISEYISQNSELNASVTAMKNQLGAALAPAINLVLNAMQRLMPIVTAVSNGINSVFTALFGKVSATSKGISSTADAASAAAESLDVYGFDQITKVSDDSGGGSGGGSAAAKQTAEQSALVQKLTGWIQQLKAAFVAGDWKGLGAIAGDGINSAINAINAVDIGSKIGRFTNNLFTTLHSFLTTVNFSNIGAKAGELLTAAFREVDWSTVGKVIGAVMVTLPSVLVGFILATDWAAVAQSLSTCLVSALDSVTAWVKSVDWLQLGSALATFIANIDWAGLATSLFGFLGSALGASVSFLWGCIDDAVHSIRDYFSEKINAAGGNVAAGLLQGIADGLVGIGIWIKENIFEPFIKGFCDIFQIHSPARAVSDKSRFISEGILSGIMSVDVFGKLKTWLKEKVLDPLTNGFNSIKNTATQAFQGLWNGARGWINKIIGGVESMVNGIIRGINGMIGAFNKIASVGDHFGVNLTISKLSTVSLPRLAKGAVVDKPTAAVIGEAGKEAVMPLENNTGWIAKLAQQINQQGGGNGKSITLAVYFRTRKLAEYVVQDINQITQETGVCPIYV